MLDTIIAGAGPAGSIAALRLARAGARVLIVEREHFPRPKLCGDTLNPGALAWLHALGLAGGPLATARPLHGMRVTGPSSSVEARYAAGVTGLALTREDLDAWLLDEAVRAGARVEHGLVVRAPLIESREGRPLVRGVIVSRRGAPAERLRLPANVTIAADGRRSVLGRALDLTHHPPQPRRWAFGVYAHGVGATSDLGEMHIRRGFYLGIAPLAAGRANVCVVRTGARVRRPLEVITDAISTDRDLRARFAGCRFEEPVTVLGPLAVEARAAGVEGLLLAGDAAGFVDPMTGDGLHLAIRSADLAASEALLVLEHGDFALAVRRLDEARRAALGSKLRFNRLLRHITSSPGGVVAGDVGAHLAPAMIRWAVRFAGDAA
jgi:flavin-dependent dehydrogenase